MSGPNLLAICHTAKLSNKSAASSVCMNGAMIFGSWREGPSQIPLHVSKSQWISIKTLSVNTFLIYIGVTCPRTHAYTWSVMHAKGNPNCLLLNHQRIKQKNIFLACDIFWHSFPKIFPILQWQKNPRFQDNLTGLSRQKNPVNDLKIPNSPRVLNKADLGMVPTSVSQPWYHYLSC